MEATPNKRFDTELTAGTGEKLLIEYKRLRPGDGRNNEADLTLKHIDVSTFVSARELLATASITESKRKFFGNAQTVGKLELNAMRQCQAYRDEMQKTTDVPIRCATAIHVTVKTGSGVNTKFESAFLVSVEPAGKQRRK